MSKSFCSLLDITLGWPKTELGWQPPLRARNSMGGTRVLLCTSQPIPTRDASTLPCVRRVPVLNAGLCSPRPTQGHPSSQGGWGQPGTPLLWPLPRGHPVPAAQHRTGSRWDIQNSLEEARRSPERCDPVTTLELAAAGYTHKEARGTQTPRGARSGALGWLWVARQAPEASLASSGRM